MKLVQTYILPMTVSDLMNSHLDDYPSARANHRFLVKLGSFRCISCGPDEISAWYGDDLALANIVPKPIAFTCFGENINDDLCCVETVNAHGAPPESPTTFARIVDVVQK